MKIILLLAAVAALAATANAQIKSEGRFTFDTLPKSWTGDAPIPTSMYPLKFQSNFDSKLPALPDFAEMRAAGVKLRIIPTYLGPMLQVEATDASMKEVLQSVTAAWGLRAVIDPTLAQQQLGSAVFRASTPQELLDVICEFSVKQFKWSDGSLYFIDKVNPGFTVALSENRANERLEKLIAEQETQARNADPFWVNPAFKKPVTPQPDWQKREFNGREFYYVPLPKP